MQHMGRPSMQTAGPNHDKIMGQDYSDAELDKAIHETVCPTDSYTAEGVYWADLPLGERVKWINSQGNQEAGRELKEIWATFKNDPVEPVRQYFSHYVVNGLGLFVEGYTLFASGNLKSLFSAVWPLCWKSARICSEGWLAAIDYLQIIGIIVGQILVGFEADSVGRRFGAIQDATLLTLGTVMLVAAWGVSLNGWIICYAWALFVYGVGVGGEYPITGTRTIELVGGGKEVQRADKLHRGRTLVLSFLMQGWGQLFNQGILIILLLIFHGGGTPPYTKVSAQWTYRISFAVILFFTLFMLYLRVYKIKNYDTKLNASKRKGAVTGYDTASLKLAFSHYGGRLFATAGIWFANDFTFYGSKLFQSSFISVIVGPNATVLTGWLYNLINIGVSLVGYYLAALLIDNKFYGRRHVGLLMIFICFVIPAFDFGPIQTDGAIKVFQFLYYMSSFFTQFGPNCVSFLAAAESYPTTIRGSAHGFSAACGKVGALMPAIIYNYVDTKTRFYIVPWFALAAFFINYGFMPELTGLDLREQERYFQYVKAGRASEYHGIAVHPRHLSAWEHYVLKRSKAYDPKLDKEAKMQELRALYHKLHGDNFAEKTLSEDTVDDDDASIMSKEVKAYFDRRTPRNSPTSTEVNGLSAGSSNSKEK